LVVNSVAGDVDVNYSFTEKFPTFEGISKTSKLQTIRIYTK